MKQINKSKKPRKPYSGSLKEMSIHDYFEAHARFTVQEWEQLHRPSKRPIGWLKTEDKLKQLFKTLRDYSFIDCSHEIFETHFKWSNLETERIKWLGRSNSLTFLIRELIDEFFIPSTQSPYLMISQHFVNANGQAYDNNRLRKNHNKGIRNPENQGNIERVMESIINN